MLIKLLKYDLKYMLKNMVAFYILSIFFAFLSRILISIDNPSLMVIIIKNISIGCMFAMVVNIIINTLMRSWVRFRDSIFKDESYLTHTLPVTKSQIYDSKFIETLIFSIVGFVISLLSVFITYFTPETWNNLKDLILGTTAALNLDSTFVIVSFIVLLFLEFFNALQCGYFGMLLGFKQSSAKTGLSVLFGFIAYQLSQFLIVGILFVIGIFNSDVSQLFTSTGTQITASTFNLLLILSFVLYFVVIVVMSFINKKIFNKGVNIE